jgi:HD-GYP domain-containing protein (c-di-GMP phosphodiesterase class II)
MTEDYQIEHNKAGEALLNAINSLTQIAKMHSDNNDLLVEGAQKFVRLIKMLGQKRTQVSIQHAHSGFYFLDEKLRIRPANTRLFNRMLRFLENRQIYGLHFQPDLSKAAPQKIITFFRLTEQAIGHEDPAGWLALQCEENDLNWVTIDQVPPAQLADPSRPADDFSQIDALTLQKAKVRKAYSHTLSSVKEVARKLSANQGAGMRNCVRLVQQMVDVISDDETLFLGISTIRIFDDYTYVHSLNVSILAMCLGTRIGLGHGALEKLGLCGLFHDLGKVAIPKELLNKRGGLSREEFDLLRTHSMHSARLILKLRAKRDRKVKLLVPPFEHHMGFDHSGYPRVTAGPGISLFGRILTIADVYDAITSPRIYREEVMSPDRALAHMMGQAGTYFDPILLKVFFDMLGVYPVGTLLQLDSGEMGIVIKPSGGADRTRPVIQLLEPDTQPTYKKGAIVDLSECDQLTGQPFRNIARSMHPSAMGIQAAEFLLH